MSVLIFHTWKKTAVNNLLKTAILLKKSDDLTDFAENLGKCSLDGT